MITKQSYHIRGKVYLVCFIFLSHLLLSFIFLFVCNFQSKYVLLGDFLFLKKGRSRQEDGWGANNQQRHVSKTNQLYMVLTTIMLFVFNSICENYIFKIYKKSFCTGIEAINANLALGIIITHVFKDTL